MPPRVDAVTVSTQEIPPPGATRRGRGAVVGLAVSVTLIAVAILLPRLADWDVHVRTWPPLHADWDPRVGPGTAPAVVLAALAVLWSFPLAQRLSWPRLLVATYAAGLAWMLSLAFVDGSRGVSYILGSSYEYLSTARRTSNLPAAIADYIDRIPFSAGDLRWPPHLAGHPPGALTFFVALDRIGLGSGFAAGMVVTLMAASTALGVMVVLRLLGAEEVARRAAPWLVFAPAAVWQCVSADAMFAAVAAWALAVLAWAATRRTPAAWPALVGGAVAGLLFGACVMLSYGLPLLGLPALAVLVVARSWRPLVPAIVAAAAVVLVYAALGFSYWSALPVLHTRYWDGVARHRPPAYWLWANFAVLSISAGPLVGAGLGQVVSRSRSLLSEPPGRVAVWLVGSFAAVVVGADATRMSMAEVERIWLPFIPWLLVGCAFVPDRWRRPGLALQVTLALAVQHLLFTGW